MRPLLLVPVLALLFGCSLTPREKMACRRAEAVLTGIGAAGDPLAAVCGEEMAAVNASTGADQIPKEEVLVTPEAAQANTLAIRADTANRIKLKGFFGNLVDEIGKRWPLVAGLAGVVAALWKTLTARSAQNAVEGMVNAGLDLRQQAKDGKLLSEQSVKDVLAFWNSLYGSKDVIKTFLADAKAAWSPPPDPPHTTIVETQGNKPT